MENKEKKDSYPLKFRLKKERITKEMLNLLDFLKSTKYGYVELKKIPHTSSYRTLINRRRLIKVRLSFKKGLGDYRRNFVDETFFNNGFYNKTFVCLNRTALVRLFMNCFREPKTFLAKRRVRGLLNRYLTHAEQIAVLWKLGKRRFRRSQLKRNLQVNGVYFPLKHKKEYK